MMIEFILQPVSVPKFLEGIMDTEQMHSPDGGERAKFIGAAGDALPRHIESNI